MGSDEEKSRKIVEVGSKENPSYYANIPKPFLLAEALKHGYNTIKAFINDYETQWYFDGGELKITLRRRPK
jgi:hypothetical protein